MLQIQMVCILVLTLLCGGIFGKEDKKRPIGKNPIRGDVVNMDVNNLDVPMENDGSLGDDGRGYYPNGTTLSFLFQGGIAASGLVNGELRTAWMAKASLIQEYLPGIWGQDPNDPTAKWYVVNKSDGFGSQAYQDWQDAVSLGANYQDLDDDPGYNPNADRPDMLGDRMIWTPFNDSTSLATRTPRLGTNPMGLEIHQTSWAFSRSDVWGDAIFFRYRLINAGGFGDIDSIYFSSWTDPDIGAAEDDLIGCDPNRNLAFCYNDLDDDSYGSNPPAFGIQLIQGPLVETGVPSDTAFRYRGDFFGTDTLIGWRNLPMTSFNQYINSDPIIGDPINAQIARYYQVGGLDANGQPLIPSQWGMINPGSCSAPNPNYFYNGNPDPDFLCGWIDNVPGDKLMMANTGPFDLAVGDTQEVIWAYVVSQGDDAINSLTKMKMTTDSLRNLFPRSGTIVGVSAPDVISKAFTLYQNYPNPFNPSTTIEFIISQPASVRLVVYNLMGQPVKTLVDRYNAAPMQAGSHQLQWDGTTETGEFVASGIYFYQLQVNGKAAATQKMILMK